MAQPLIDLGPNSVVAEGSDLDGKLNSTAVAVAFSATTSYLSGEYVTYNGAVYRFTANHAAGAWIGTDAELITLTAPDASIDISSTGALKVVKADGTVLWEQGYNLNTTSSETCGNENVNYYGFAANAYSAVTLTLPTVSSGKVGDFILDVTNPALDTTAASWSAISAFDSTATYAVNAVVTYDSKIWKCTTAVETAGAWTGATNWTEAWPTLSLGTALNNTISVVVPKGESLSDMLAIAPGTTCELYFTLTAFQLNSLPTWKIVRQDVENGAPATT